MKAVIYKEYGTPQVLQAAEVEKPIPADNEIRIKIQHAEVTKADCEMRSLKFQVNWLRVPMRIALGITKPRKHILGAYFAGEVESTGQNVSRFKKGDQIFGASGIKFGCHAEYICLPEN